MSKKRRRYDGCTLCQKVPAPYRLMESRGVQIINKGRVCQACMNAWLATQKKDDDRVSSLLPTTSDQQKTNGDATNVPDEACSGSTRYGARPV